MSTTIVGKIDLHALFRTLMVTEKSETDVSTTEVFASITKELLPTLPKKRPTETGKESFSPPISISNETSHVSKEGVLLEGILKAIEDAAVVPRTIAFSVFNDAIMRAFRGIICVLYNIFPENMLPLIRYLKKHLHWESLRHTLTIVIRHRPDFVAAGVQVPSFIAINPMFFSDLSVVHKQLYLNWNSGKDQPIEIEIPHDFTATNADPEHFIAYFREDFGISLHHQHWHEVYPFDGCPLVVMKDRRGELFIYMHAQLLARYNFERICAGLPSVEKFDNFRETIVEPYYPKLDEATKIKIWSPRQPNAQLSDVDRDFLYCEVRDLERWQERLIEAVDQGYIYKRSDDGKVEFKKLSDEENPIDGLGCTIEASEILSFNYPYYGTLHNNGHNIISLCHDPKNKFKEPANIMAYNQANLRDPIFYRWHAYIDDMVERYRYKLPQYEEKQKEFKDIEVKSLSIECKDEKANTIRTYWQKDRVEVSKGALTPPEGSPPVPKIYVKFTHLQHKKFRYRFSVNNTANKQVTAFVRIFMATLHDETRREMPFNKLRRYMIELDKFTVQLQKGENVFCRDSTESSVTIPFDQMFMSYDQAYEMSTQQNKGKDPDGWCGCGWPQHLLVGRGTELGTHCTLFAMLTDYDQDKVESSSTQCCEASVSYCGIRSSKYPDKRPMGFPFDRPIGDPSASLKDFMTRPKTLGFEKGSFQNMITTDIIIVHDSSGQACDGKTIVVPPGQQPVKCPDDSLPDKKDACKS